MVGIGNSFADVGTYIDLQPIGMIGVESSYGVLGIIGTSARGPSNQVVVLSQPSDGLSIFRSGPVKDAIELAFGNYCDTNFALRVLGEGAAKSSVYLTDGLTPPSNLVLVEAIGEGGYGDGIAVVVTGSGYNRTCHQLIQGDGSDDPYSLEHCDIVEDTTNWIEVQQVRRTIVYLEDNLGIGKVFVDTVNGKIKFYTTDKPLTDEEIEVYLKYETKNVRVTLGNEDAEQYQDVIDLIDLTARMARGTKVRGTIEVGETHLPANGSYRMTGGSDGSEPTTDDWRQAMLILGETLRLYAGAPTAIALCDIETSGSPNTRNLLPIFTEFLGYMADMEAPCLGFVGVNPADSLLPEGLMNTTETFQDRNLVIVGNPWDTSTPRRNGAVARAAKECSLPLGESAAMDQNALQGMGPLLYEYNPTAVVALTRRGVDVLEKVSTSTTGRGIKPHKGVTTSSVEQWKRTVDQRTINFVIVSTFQLTRKFRFHRNINLERTALRNSIKAFLEDMLRKKNIYDYVLMVTQHPTNPNMVLIEMRFIPIGHMEFFDVSMGVGVYEDLTTFAGV